MKIVQHRKFSNAFKRLPRPEQLSIEEAIKKIMENPIIGEMKKGDLAGVRVHKFKHNEQLKLLAYTHSDESITLLAYGSHENFYRDLKA
jgi:mRNA-degrading endonuclease RelE of RelBE toxin-antitoxin system